MAHKNECKPGTRVQIKDGRWFRDLAGQKGTVLRFRDSDPGFIESTGLVRIALDSGKIITILCDHLVFPYEPNYSESFMASLKGLK